MLRIVLLCLIFQITYCANACGSTWQNSYLGRTDEITCHCDKKTGTGVYGAGPYFTINSDICKAATFLGLAPGDIKLRGAYWVAGYDQALSNGVQTWKHGFDHLAFEIIMPSPPHNSKFGCYSKGNRMNSGRWGGNLLPGQCLISKNGAYAAIMQVDGNFVVKNQKKVLFSTDRYGNTREESLTWRKDGNFNVYYKEGGDWKSYWATNKHWRGWSYVVMQDDGNLVTYTWNDESTWSSKTQVCNVEGDELKYGEMLSAEKDNACLISPNGLYTLQFNDEKPRKLCIYELGEKKWCLGYHYDHLKGTNEIGKVKGLMFDQKGNLYIKGTICRLSLLNHCTPAQLCTIKEYYYKFMSGSVRGDNTEFCMEREITTLHRKKPDNSVRCHNGRHNKYFCEKVCTDYHFWEIKDENKDVVLKPGSTLEMHEDGHFDVWYGTGGHLVWSSKKRNNPQQRTDSQVQVSGDPNAKEGSYYYAVIDPAPVRVGCDKCPKKQSPDGTKCV